LPCEVAVEGERGVDPLAAHQLEADVVDEGDRRSTGGQECRGCRQVESFVDPGELYCREEVADESPGGVVPEATVYERDRLDDDVVVRDERLRELGERFGRRLVVRVVRRDSGVDGRRV
jgi:uncharacterized protein CbrC (UPF0167 family)